MQTSYPEGSIKTLKELLELPVGTVFYQVIKLYECSYYDPITVLKSLTLDKTFIEGTSNRFSYRDSNVESLNGYNNHFLFFTKEDASNYNNKSDVFTTEDIERRKEDLAMMNYIDSIYDEDQ